MYNNYNSLSLFFGFPFLCFPFLQRTQNWNTWRLACIKKVMSFLRVTRVSSLLFPATRPSNSWNKRNNKRCVWFFMWRTPSYTKKIYLISWRHASVIITLNCLRAWELNLSTCLLALITPTAEYLKGFCVDLRLSPSSRCFGPTPYISGPTLWSIDGRKLK